MLTNDSLCDHERLIGRAGSSTSWDRRSEHGDDGLCSNRCYTARKSVGTAKRKGQRERRAGKRGCLMGPFADRCGRQVDRRLSQAVFLEGVGTKLQENTHGLQMPMAASNKPTIRQKTLW